MINKIYIYRKKVLQISNLLSCSFAFSCEMVYFCNKSDLDDVHIKFTSCNCIITYYQIKTIPVVIRLSPILRIAKTIKGFVEEQNELLRLR